MELSKIQGIIATKDKEIEDWKRKCEKLTNDV